MMRVSNRSFRAICGIKKSLINNLLLFPNNSLIADLLFCPLDLFQLLSGIFSPVGVILSTFSDWSCYRRISWEFPKCHFVDPVSKCFLWIQSEFKIVKLHDLCVCHFWPFPLLGIIQLITLNLDGKFSGKARIIPRCFVYRAFVRISAASP